MLTVPPRVRVSVRHDNDENSTLRCYAEGYYPDYSMDMMWYYDNDPDAWFRSPCQHALNSDGTYRLTCDHACNRNDIHRFTCRVRQGFVSIDAGLRPERETMISITNLYIMVLFITLCMFMFSLLYVYENDIVVLVKTMLYTVCDYRRMTQK